MTGESSTVTPKTQDALHDRKKPPLLSPLLLTLSRMDKSTNTNNLHQENEGQEGLKNNYNGSTTLGELSWHTMEEGSCSSEGVSLPFPHVSLRPSMPFNLTQDMALPIVITPDSSPMHRQKQACQHKHQGQKEEDREQFSADALSDFRGRTGKLLARQGDFLYEAQVNGRKKLQFSSVEQEEQLPQQSPADQQEPATLVDNCTFSSTWRLPRTYSCEDKKEYEQQRELISEVTTGAEGPSLACSSPRTRSVTLCQLVSVSRLSNQEIICGEEPELLEQIRQQPQRRRTEEQQLNLETGESHGNLEKIIIPHAGYNDSAVNASPTSVPSLSFFTSPMGPASLVQSVTSVPPLESFCSVSVSPLSVPLSTRIDSSQSTHLFLRESCAMFGVLTPTQLQGTDSLSNTHGPQTHVSSSLNCGSMEGYSSGCLKSTSGVYDLNFSRNLKHSTASALSQRPQSLSPAKNHVTGSDVVPTQSSSLDAMVCFKRENENEKREVKASPTVMSLQVVIPPALAVGATTTKTKEEGEEAGTSLSFDARSPRVNRVPPFHVMRRPPTVPYKKPLSQDSVPVVEFKSFFDEYHDTVFDDDNNRSNDGYDDLTLLSHRRQQRFSCSSPLLERRSYQRCFRGGTKRHRRSHDDVRDMSLLFEELEQIRLSNHEALEERELQINLASDMDLGHNVAINTESGLGSDRNSNNNNDTSANGRSKSIDGFFIRRRRRSMISRFKMHKTDDDMLSVPCVNGVKKNGDIVAKDNAGHQQEIEEATTNNQVIRGESFFDGVFPNDVVCFSVNQCGLHDDMNVECGEHQSPTDRSNGDPHVSLKFNMEENNFTSPFLKKLKKCNEASMWNMDKGNIHTDNENGDSKAPNPINTFFGSSGISEGILCDSGESLCELSKPSTLTPGFIFKHTPRSMALQGSRANLVLWLHKLSISPHNETFLRVSEINQTLVKRCDTRGITRNDEKKVEKDETGRFRGRRRCLWINHPSGIGNASTRHNNPSTTRSVPRSIAVTRATTLTALTTKTMTATTTTVSSLTTSRERKVFDEMGKTDISTGRKHARGAIGYTAVHGNGRMSLVRSKTSCLRTTKTTKAETGVTRSVPRVSSPTHIKTSVTSTANMSPTRKTTSRLLHGDIIHGTWCKCKQRFSSKLLSRLDMSVSLSPLRPSRHPSAS